MYDIIGIGVGVFNLSLAALLDDISEVRSAFFERNSHFAWHPNLMLAGTRLQTSYLKDLVTPVKPTSPYSFLSYIVSRKRFYQFLNAHSNKTVSRFEFNDYLAWVAQRLKHIHFSALVREVAFEKGHFLVRLRDNSFRSKNLVVAVGLEPFIPDWAKPHLLSGSCFHASQFLLQPLNVANKTVIVVGGGQTGAEVFLTILKSNYGLPRKLVWITRRANYESLDESFFINEYFTPSYVEQFFSLSTKRKYEIVDSQKLAGNGISHSTLEEIYYELYTRSLLQGDKDMFHLLPNREVVDMASCENGQFLLTTHNKFSNTYERVEGSCVILCTGSHSVVPSFIAPIHHRLNFDEKNHFIVSRNFALQWDGPSDRRIYVQNASLYNHGIAEPQMSLMSWRSATIINDLLGKSVFDLDDPIDLIEWVSDSEVRANVLSSSEGSHKQSFSSRQNDKLSAFCSEYVQSYDQTGS